MMKDTFSLVSSTLNHLKDRFIRSYLATLSNLPVSVQLSKGDETSAGRKYARIDWKNGDRVYYVMLAGRQLSRCFNLPVWILSDKPVLFLARKKSPNVKQYVFLSLMLYACKPERE